jgi:hypothetical protein
VAAGTQDVFIGGTGNDMFWYADTCSNNVPIDATSDAGAQPSDTCGDAAEYGNPPGWTGCDSGLTSASKPSSCP